MVIDPRYQPGPGGYYDTRDGSGPYTFDATGRAQLVVKMADLNRRTAAMRREALTTEQKMALQVSTLALTVNDLARQVGVLNTSQETQNTDIAALKASRDKNVLAIEGLQKDVQHTVVYPAGGTPTAPGAVVPNRQYTFDNPWPGSRVICDAELLINGVWGRPGWYADTLSASGIRAEPLGDKIVLTTGKSRLLSIDPYSSGGSFGGVLISPASAPCRVLLWRAKS